MLLILKKFAGFLMVRVNKTDERPGGIYAGCALSQQRESFEATSTDLE